MKLIGRKHLEEFLAHSKQLTLAIIFIVLFVRIKWNICNLWKLYKLIFYVNNKEESDIFFKSDYLVLDKNLWGSSNISAWA